MSGDRWRVKRTFRAHLGWCSVLIDSLTRRRIIVAGKDHQDRAERRRAELEAAAKKEGKP